jgi:C-terminal processing protease CtpA/Prc
MAAFIVVLLLWGFSQAPTPQETEPRYAIGMDITGSKSPCPVFVDSVRKNFPAAQSGIRPGDRLIAVDGNSITTAEDAAQHIRSTSANPVVLQFARDDQPYSVTVARVDFAKFRDTRGDRV